MTQNPAITKAYELGEYTDVNGVTWIREADGWADTSDPRVYRLEYAARMDALIEKENPTAEKPLKKTGAKAKVEEQ